MYCRAAVGDEQIVDGVEGDGRAQQPAGARDLQPRPPPRVGKPAAHNQTAEDVHGSRAEAPEEDEGEAVCAVLDEIADIFKGGEGEGDRDGGYLDFIRPPAQTPADRTPAATASSFPPPPARSPPWRQGHPPDTPPRGRC